MGLDAESGKLEAIKIFFPKKSKLQSLKLKKKVINQAKLQAKINHPNVVKVNHYFDSIPLYDSNGFPVSVSAIATEYIDLIGDLDDLIHLVQRMPEPLARSYFHKIIDALEEMHANNVAHANLRPENILFDKSFNLKITGFGNAKVCSRDKPFKIKIREVDYYPPEVYNGMLRKRTDLDVFAAGIILFLMVFGHIPFSRAEIQNPVYRLLIYGEFERFWAVHDDILDMNDAEIGVSNELKELLERTFDPNPNTRAGVEWIKQCDWYNGPTMGTEGLEKYLRIIG